MIYLFGEVSVTQPKELMYSIFLELVILSTENSAKTTVITIIAASIKNYFIFVFFELLF